MPTRYLSVYPALGVIRGIVTIDTYLASLRLVVSSRAIRPHVQHNADLAEPPPSFPDIPLLTVTRPQKSRMGNPSGCVMGGDFFGSTVTVVIMVARCSVIHRSIPVCSPIQHARPCPASWFYRRGGHPYYRLRRLRGSCSRCPSHMVRYIGRNDDYYTTRAITYACL